MEKRCEFCKALSPVVFCKSDAAHLCLSCDAKVHSANALSYRHPRTLVCESCRLQPALVRCFDHQTFMCQSCDIGHHVSLDHHKKIISCYVGCPSAKDLAELWGIQFKDLDASRMSCSSSRGIKVRDDHSQQRSSYLILQQILDLEKLQLAEGIDDSCLTHVKERPAGAPLDATWKEHRMLESHPEHSDAPLLDKNEEVPISSPFPQLDGEAFWQYRSPVHNNEIWLQNMQDLGVCDEVECFDDISIPDVDLTFRNFEELFSGEDPRIEQSENQLQQMRPSHSVSSFSVSRIAGDSSGSYDELCPTFTAKQRISRGGETAGLRCKDKKFAGHGQYTSARSNSGFKKRGKSQVWKTHEGDSGSF